MPASGATWLITWYMRGMNFMFCVMKSLTSCVVVIMISSSGWWPVSACGCLKSGLACLDRSLLNSPRPRSQARSHRDEEPASLLGDGRVDQPDDEQACEYQVDPVEGLRVQVVGQGGQDSHVGQAPEPARHRPVGHDNLAGKVFVAGRQGLARPGGRVGRGWRAGGGLWRGRRAGGVRVRRHGTLGHFLA